MKIVHVTETAMTGVAVHIRWQLELQNQQGHDVTVVYSPLRQDHVFRDARALLEPQGVKFVELELPYSLGPKDFGAMRRLRATFKSLGTIDVLHLHSSKAGLLGRIAGRGLSKATFYTPHMFRSLAPWIGKKERRLAMAFERYFARFANKVICVSEGEAAHAEKEIGIPRSRIALVHNATRYVPKRSREEARGELGLEDGEALLGFVGRLSPQKNPTLFLDVLHALDGKAAFKGVLLGDGPDRQANEEYAKSIGLDGKAVFVGEQPIANWMHAFDLFVLSSQAEGLPTTLIEATLADTPWVSTDVAGVSEILPEPLAWMIAPLSDPAKLAANTLAALSDPEKTKEARALLETRAPYFAPERMVGQTMDLYRTALG